jgi:hypothetical protein
MNPNAGGGGRGEVAGVSANEYSSAHGAQINYGDLAGNLNHEMHVRVMGPNSLTFIKKAKLKVMSV